MNIDEMIAKLDQDQQNISSLQFRLKQIKDFGVSDAGSAASYYIRLVEDANKRLNEYQEGSAKHLRSVLDLLISIYPELKALETMKAFW